MTGEELQARLNEAQLGLPGADLTPFGGMVAELERITGWLRGSDLSYADEPAVCFQAPQG